MLVFIVHVYIEMKVNITIRNVQCKITKNSVTYTISRNSSALNKRAKIYFTLATRIQYARTYSGHSERSKRQLRLGNYGLERSLCLS